MDRGRDRRAAHAELAGVSVMNFGGNKLDQFLHVTATLVGQRPGPAGCAGPTSWSTSTTRPRPGWPATSSGPNPDSGAAEGVYQGIFAVNVPGAASLPTLQGVAPLLAAGIDGPTKSVAGGYFQIPQGQTLRASRRFRAARRRPPGRDRAVGPDPTHHLALSATTASLTPAPNAWRGRGLALWLRLRGNLRFDGTFQISGTLNVAMGQA